MRTLDIDRYVIETLMPDLVGHDRQPAAFLVFLFLWLRAGRSGLTRSSLREIAEGTGLSRRAVQSAIVTLVRRGLLSVRREGVTSVPTYGVLRPWTRRSG